MTHGMECCFQHLCIQPLIFVFGAWASSVLSKCPSRGKKKALGFGKVNGSTFMQASHFALPENCCGLDFSCTRRSKLSQSQPGEHGPGSLVCTRLGHPHVKRQFRPFADESLPLTMMSMEHAIKLERDKGSSANVVAICECLWRKQWRDGGADFL